jgi:putative transcriptional regulator
MNKEPRKEYPFDADELLASLKDIRDHVHGTRKITMRTTTVRMPTAVKTVLPNQVKSIRARMNVSQEVFARLLNVPLVTAKSWEAGRRKPSGAAARLLRVAEQKPELLLDAVVS